jgi:predicted nucleotidyltransferase
VSSLDANIASHLATVCARHPAITELWLLGSRANGNAKADSDWDVLAFADEPTLTALRAKPELKRADVDFLVVVDGDRFESPWWRLDKPRKYKKGRLKSHDAPDGSEVCGWEWERVSDSEARYTGGGFEPFRAFRIHIPVTPNKSLERTREG